MHSRETSWRWSEFNERMVMMTMIIMIRIVLMMIVMMTMTIMIRIVLMMIVMMTMTILIRIVLMMMTIE